ncbi:MAG: phage Gp37/Gp68 family protein [Proteobacteria bacterium]|nr:phage Gp37/Gp68 family protein [Pseudomonadota bacterium]MBU4470278.1 phage Gp37/Gp68 family protein [Pseudomonadota bacterium]MCG2752691.1 phage Gp37/Gp68 family protein [Desulfobacteraceae bacterium]
MLNKQGPGKIDYCDYTWNPITGYCWHACPYCYMRPMWGRFPNLSIQKFRLDYLQDKFPKKSSVIFVGSSTDMWGEWVPGWMIQSVLNVIEFTPKHTFLFLSKNPYRYLEFDIPKNCWCGTSVDGLANTSDNVGLLQYVLRTKVLKTWISVEPMIDKVLPNPLVFADWIVIGADSRPGADRPAIEWAEDIYCAAMCAGKPVWIKENYHYPETIKMKPKGF